ncbi:adenylate cyclase regulatory domain-containing protein [Paraconexibacter sp.]|uniref:adenylate/guanylate cyclase domain-containing protein n=1 Tax=Paraconexibacter sp. TaxID=2949640 RepID=UPI003565CFD7
MSDAIDWAATGLLEGLEGDARAERIDLLDWLIGRGFTLEELEAVDTPWLLPFLPAERLVMDGPPTLTGRQLAERAGVELEMLQALRRSHGMPILDPDVVEFSEREVEAARSPALFRALGLSDDQILDVSRVLGRGLAQTAQVMRATVLELALEPGLDERQLAERYEATVEAILPYVGPLLENTVRMHLRNMVRAEAVDDEARQLGRLPGERVVGVAFADLVGFTRMGEEVPAEEVGRVAARLEALAAGVANAPVRLVKTIGDAVMLTCDDVPALGVACLDLLEAVIEEGEDFPQLRVGMAYGPAAHYGADWFGAPVNLASRLTSLARTGSVLAAPAVREAAGDDPRLRWSFAGERRVKGVSAPVKTFRLRRAEAA